MDKYLLSSAWSTAPLSSTHRQHLHAGICDYCTCLTTFSLHARSPLSDCKFVDFAVNFGRATLGGMTPMFSSQRAEASQAIGASSAAITAASQGIQPSQVGH